LVGRREGFVRGGGGGIITDLEWFTFIGCG
jgi:hypothetical protein